jgi:hypothetical protein
MTPNIEAPGFPKQDILRFWNQPENPTTTLSQRDDVEEAETKKGASSIPS